MKKNQAQSTGRGGKRLGAGRKPGVQNKVNALAKVQALAGGESPLEYMLGIMRDTRKSAKVRAEMAKSAAPYVHPRLAATEFSGNPEAPVLLNVQTEGERPLTEEELIAECERRGLPTKIFQD